MSMTQAEYAAYEKAVKEFFDKEGINCLSSGHPYCPDCGPEYEWNDDNCCPNCGRDRDEANEPSFSWTNCHCCNRPLGGNRYHATGYNPETEEIQEYEVCEDCVYYAEYGQLDDQTMLDLEESGPTSVTG